MKNISKLQQYSIIFVYLLINSIFILKYSVRYSLSPVPFIIGYIIVVIAIIFTLFFKRDVILKLNKTIYLWFCLLVALLLFISTTQFDISNIRVSRYAAIQEWLFNFLNGIFPYGSPTNPSGFPILFLAFTPFALVGELGLMQVLTYILISLYLFKKFKNRQEVKWSVQILLLISPIYHYEIITRSELFSNMVFVLLFVDFVSKQNVKRINFNKLLFISILGGLLLSTRMILLPIYFILLIYYFRQDLKRLFILFLGIGFIFLLTLVPFFFWNPSSFIEKGPFAVQSLYLPIEVVAIFLAGAVYLGFKIKDEKSLYFSTAIILFLFVAASFLFHLQEHTLFELIYKDRFDVAYFIFPLVFILMQIDNSITKN